MTHQVAGTGARVGRLDADVTSFVGRRAEIAELKRLAAVSRLVTVTGPGGAGKSRLALRVAAELRLTFADGAWLVDLAPLRDPELVGYAVIQALGIDDQSERPVPDVLADHLRDREPLLVLDNCEQVRGACAALAGGLLHAVPRLVVLCTSRRPLEVAGERVWAMPPMPAPDGPVAVDQPQTGQFDAVALFSVRAAAADPGFTLDPDNAGTVARICREVDGLPLAIELAAAHLRTRTLTQVASGLRDRFTLQRATPTRHRTLETTLDWSFQLCTPAERTMWIRLSVFAGDFDRTAVAAVCPDQPPPGPLLAALVGRAVLVHTPDDRYRMLDTVRNFGAARLAGRPDELADLRGRHRDHYQRLAGQAERDWFGPAQEQVYTGLRREHDNLRAALAYGMDAGTPERTLRLAATLWFYWTGCGFLAEGAYWLDRALAAVPDAGPDRIRALWAYGAVVVAQGDTATAERVLGTCLAAASAAGDDLMCGYAELSLGTAALFVDDHARARELLQRAAHRFEARGELNSAILLGHAELAMVVAVGGDLDTAEDICVHALINCKRRGDRWARGWMFYVLALTALARGDSRTAVVRAAEGLRLHRVFHNLTGLAMLLELTATALVAEGVPDRSAVLHGAAARMWRTLGRPMFGSPAMLAQHEACAAAAAAAIGEHGYETGYRMGLSMDVDDAVGYALAASPVSSAGDASPAG